MAPPAAFPPEHLFLVRSINHHSLLSTTVPTGKVLLHIVVPTRAHTHPPEPPFLPPEQHNNAPWLQNTAEKENEELMGLSYASIMGDVPFLELGKRSHKVVKEHAQGHVVNQWESQELCHCCNPWPSTLCTTGQLLPSD